MGIRINTFAVSHMDIGTTCNFHRNVNEEIKKATPEVLHIEDKAENYNRLCEKLQLIVNRATTFVSTKKLKVQDRIRCNYVGVINNVSLDHVTNPNTEKRKAARLLKAVLSPYFGIGRHKYAQKTAEIKSMVARLKEPENAAAAELLGLTTEVEGLEEANKLFSQTIGFKADEYTARQDQKDIDSRILCRQANAAFNEIIKIVNAFAIVQTSEALEQFIDKINGYVALYSSIIDRKRGKEKEEEGSDPA